MTIGESLSDNLVVQDICLVSLVSCFVGFMSLFLSGIFKVGDFKCIVEIIIVI